MLTMAAAVVVFNITNEIRKKTMTKEAPEKIYLFENPVTESPDDRWLSTRSDDADIEYIRTDVFIEKACEFLKSYRQDTCDGLGYIAGIVNDETIKDFKKYMKVE